MAVLSTGRRTLKAMKGHNVARFVDRLTLNQKVVKALKREKNSHHNRLVQSNEKEY